MKQWIPLMHRDLCNLRCWMPFQSSYRERPTSRTAPMTCTLFLKKVTLRTPMVKKRLINLGSSALHYPPCWFVDCQQSLFLCIYHIECGFYLSTWRKEIFWFDCCLGSQEQICCLGSNALCKCIWPFQQCNMLNIHNACSFFPHFFFVAAD